MYHTATFEEVVASETLMILYVVLCVDWEMGSMMRHVLETLIMLSVTDASWQAMQI